MSDDKTTTEDQMLLVDADEVLAEVLADFPGWEEQAQTDEAKYTNDAVLSNIRTVFAKDMSDAEAGLMAAAVASYVEARLDQRLQETLPESLFERMGEMAEKGEITTEQMYGMTAMSYQLVTTESLFAYAEAVAKEVIQDFAQLYYQAEENLRVFAKASPEDRERIGNLLREKRFDDLDQLIGSIDIL